MKLLIFDLDGTLLNTLEDLADSANHILQQHHLPTHPIDAYRYFVGNGIPKLIERIMPEGKKQSTEYQQCLQEFLAYYQIHLADKTHPYEGMTETLEILQSRGIKLAVATNKVHSAVAPLMQDFFPTIHFDVMIGQREGVPVKPAPQIVFDIMAAAGCEAKDTLYAGDTSVDVQTGHNAGLPVIGLLWGYRPRKELEDSGADYLISSPRELLNFC